MAPCETALVARLSIRHGVSEDAVRTVLNYVAAAELILEKAGVRLDEGAIMLDPASSVGGVVAACRKLRHWPREEHAQGKER